MMQNTAKIIDTRQDVSGLEAEWLTRFLNSLEGSAATVASYGRALKRMLAYFRERGITHPSPDDLRAYRKELLATVKPNTTQLYMTTARLFYSFCEERGLYQNIAKGIKGARVDKSFKKDYLTAGQVLDIVSGVDSLRDRAMLMLMVTAGLRCCEVVRANIADLQPVGNSPALFIQGKGHLEADQYVKLAPLTYKILLAYLASRGNTDRQDPLFCSDANRNKGQRLTTMSVSRICKQAFRAAGYDSPRLTAHSCRHTAATLNKIAGATDEENQQFMRHQDPATTAKYNHYVNRIKNNSEARIENYIWAGKSLSQQEGKYD